MTCPVKTNDQATCPAECVNREVTLREFVEALKESAARCRNILASGKGEISQIDQIAYIFDETEMFELEAMLNLYNQIRGKFQPDRSER